MKEGVGKEKEEEREQAREKEREEVRERARGKAREKMEEEREKAGEKAEKREGEGGKEEEGEDEEGEDEEGAGGVRGRGDSASQPRLYLLLSRQGAAESLRPAVVAHPLGQLGVDDL
jgi:hypothetical protein